MPAFFAAHLALNRANSTCWWLCCIGYRRERETVELQCDRNEKKKYRDPLSSAAHKSTLGALPTVQRHASAYSSFLFFFSIFHLSLSYQLTSYQHTDFSFSLFIRIEIRISSYTQFSSRPWKNRDILERPLTSAQSSSAYTLWLAFRFTLYPNIAYQHK